MRGSRHVDYLFLPCIGSIPASAGQPRRRIIDPLLPTVYPRECGAARSVRPGCHTCTGLSPRVRGSLISISYLYLVCRSIPASAGQPIVIVVPPSYLRVYPRECGAAFIPDIDAIREEGLSPRVRGSRALSRVAKLFRRSIPASAGQPHPCNATRRSSTVYPRECGAASPYPLGTLNVPGLSPRVRGSRANRPRHPSLRRSIPASAGQPGVSRHQPASDRVYPRECGAASVKRISINNPLGLSPRVRGSRLLRDAQVAVQRSIPASAGQPRTSQASLLTGSVYPRECGAARSGRTAWRVKLGLSPRVRGSLFG